jgi:hypothetical protein
MARFVPDPSFGVLPPGAHIQTVGLATAVGGLLFGVGMVLAGGCVSGTLWRMGEGYLNSWVAMAGILVGLWAASETWDWWYDNDVSKRTAIWLPKEIGTGLSVIAVLAVLAGWSPRFWWETRSPALPSPPPRPRWFDRREQYMGLEDIFGGGGWSYLQGAVALAILAPSYGLQAPPRLSSLGLWGDKLASR